MAGNIARLLAQHVDDPGRVLYRHFTDGDWRDVGAAEIATLAGAWQAAFRRDGLNAGDRIALCAKNGVSWVAIDLAALGMGLVMVPLYVDDNPDSVAWCIGHAAARLIVVENARIAAALASVNGSTSLPPVVVLRAGRDATFRTAQDYLDGASGDLLVTDLPDDALATICFTSGTAGRPKGVMLSHANILANVAQCRATGMARPEDVFLSILPLSHMFERTGGYYLPLALEARVVFARGVAQLAEDFAEQAPTVVFAVPRIFERLRARIAHALKGDARGKWMFDACVERGWRVSSGRASMLDRVLASLLRRIVGRAVLAKLGGRLRIAVVGGAALDPELARTFIGLGLSLLQGYGMTEASPVVSVNLAGDNDPESVGPPVSGVEVRLRDGGELLVRGANVMQGYWRDPEATRAVLTADGWLCTGDIAELRNGRIFIRGRSKDILVLSNGEKLPPQDVEFAILRDPVFEQVMLVGEGRPFVVLLAVTPERDEKELVRRANAQLSAFPRWARVRRVVIAPQPWGVDNGLLTPTLKLKRRLLASTLAREIEAAYGDSTD